MTRIELLNRKLFGVDYNYAMKILTDENSGVDLLGKLEIDAISWLIQQVTKKETRVKPLTDPFKMAALFVAKKDVRFYLKYIYSDGSQFVASNGHTLIVINHVCEPGFYDVLGFKQDVDAQYFDYLRILRNIEALGLNKSRAVNLDDGVDDVMIVKSKNIAFKRFGDDGFDVTYLNLLKKLGIKTARICSKALYHFDDNIKVVVMPMIIK